MSLLTLPQRGWVASRPDVSRRRRTFRHDGLLAFTSWSKIAREWRDAEIAWETRQDEGPLRTFVNTRAGQNYRAKSSGEKPLDGDDLAKRLEGGWKSGLIPAGVQVIVVAIDVQRDRFEVLVFGFGENMEGWIIDRYPIDVMPDGLTIVQPFRHPEHWQVLLPLFDKKWALADGSGRKVPALTIAIDTGGGDMAGDDSALKFWHAARALGIHQSRITLLKGSSLKKGPLMPTAQFSDRKVGGGAKRQGPKLFLPLVYSIKGVIDNRLRRTTPGPGYIHIPEWLAPKTDRIGSVRDHAYLDEMTAERLMKGKWEKTRPRNETWDLLVYAYAALLRPPFAQSRAHMRWVPAAYRVPEQTALTLVAEPITAADAATITSKPASPPKPARAKVGAGLEVTRKPANRFTKRPGNWMEKR